MQRAKNEYEEFEKKKIDKQIATIKRRLDSLYIDKLDGKISEEFFEEKNIEWHAEQNKLLTKLQSLNNVSREFYEGSNLLLDFCKSADRLYIQASPEKKRQILKLIGSNFIYKSGNVAITLNPAFDFLLNCDLFHMVDFRGRTSHFVVLLKILELLKSNQGKKKEPLKALFFKMVEDRRFELLTSCVQNRHSTN